MEMQDVELVGMLTYAVEHEHVIGNCVANIYIEPQRLRHATDQIGCRDAVAAGEKGHVMTQAHKFFGEVGNDPFGAAVEPGGEHFP